jgi:hypothetical protein
VSLKFIFLPIKFLPKSIKLNCGNLTYRILTLSTKWL